MRDPRLDELIQMETWDWWKAQVFYLREKKDYADTEELLELAPSREDKFFKVPKIISE